MLDSSTHSPGVPTHTSSYRTVPLVPVEIVSEEEMALIEAALAATRSSLSSASSSAFSALSSSSSSPSLFSSLPSTCLQQNARSIRSITTLLSKRRSSDCAATSSMGDIEDSDDGFRSTQKRNGVTESLLDRFRRKRGLSVTDITATEWCEKQMEFVLLFGKPRITKAMKAGIARHADLEEEIVKRARVHVESVEDIWAIKFMNFIVGANQLMFDGLTRELPLIGFVEGVWMVGVIDEIRMPITGTERNPTLVDTKTRVQAKIPSEPQRRNGRSKTRISRSENLFGRLQLMCYKYLWDNLVADKFPFGQFFNFFSLNPHRILSEEIRENTAESGFPAETLHDLLEYFRNTCCILPPSHDQLLLRYELQEDHSLISEDQFDHDSDWLKSKIQFCVEFWQGEREASYTPVDERWKCRFCKFVSACPANTGSEGTPS